MVAPEDDYPSRPARRRNRVFAQPAQPAGELIQDLRASIALRMTAAFFFAVAFLWPDIGDDTVVRLFAAYALVDGVLSLASGGWEPTFRLGWPLLIGGVINLVGSGTAFAWPEMTPPVFADLVAIWAIASSFAFAAAYAALRQADSDQLLLLCAIASLILGRALLSQFAADPIILSTWMGLYTMTMSVLLLKLTLRNYRVILL
ncbi:MAG: DUF308 domain-containing protein [Alphaproteobacteria bacterium]